MFRPDISIDLLNQISQESMVDHLGIEFIEIGSDFIKATMPVDHRTRQPMGLLHGGASMALAETLGSIAATCCVDNSKQYCVGLEINANHIKSAREGFVQGICKAVHIGKKTHVWEIKIYDRKEQLICISRITIAVIDHKKA
ncbi:hotdog fold thioesterase [Xanthovirga aplysinae]|uniref:hotdog fold thioesterase n=1 Tax=Xanthovirga aplysinae TaxID=2529853 RepID=UPI0012BCCA4D|nr:hotdog fold thioesterase [Xanthovirga aplysinae]MTI33208.1 hotdog fold thioesterase [Xanthovirga aplysinae]